MSGAPRRKRSTRKRKIWISLYSLLVGTAGLTALALCVQSSRDTDLEDPTEGLTARFRTGAGANAPPLRFVDVAEAVGIRVRHGAGVRTRNLPEDTGSGLAWGDVDGDGDWDLYVVNYPATGGVDPDPPSTNRLFRNDGGQFVDVTAAAGVADADGFGMGAYFADFDADGDIDLYVTNFGPNRLFRGRGDGTFDEVAVEAGVADAGWSTGAAWGDFDRDGHLDLYVCNYVDYDLDPQEAELLGGTAFGPYTVPFTLNPNSFDPQPNRLFRGRGDGTFENVARRCLVDNPEGRSLSAVFCDLDGDGWLDLYVNNDVSANRLYRNLGADVATADEIFFADESTTTGTADPRGSMGLSVGEIAPLDGEPDGLPDLFITHWVAQENAWYESLVMAGGRLEYRDKTRRLRLGEISIDQVGWGSALVDLDLDGRVDIAVANGSTLEVKGDPARLVAQPVNLFWNAGSNFHDLAPEAGPDTVRPYVARGLAAADFDGDGDVDLALSVNRGPVVLLRNDTETGGTYALRVRLDAPAAACFGARVEVRTPDGAQYRWWGADVSLLSMHAPELIFGLGRRARVAHVVVRWADGTETALHDVPAGPLVVRRR